MVYICNESINLLVSPCYVTYVPCYVTYVYVLQYYNFHGSTIFRILVHASEVGKNSLACSNSNSFIFHDLEPNLVWARLKLVKSCSGNSRIVFAILNNLEPNYESTIVVQSFYSSSQFFILLSFIFIHIQFNYIILHIHILSIIYF